MGEGKSPAQSKAFYLCLLTAVALLSAPSVFAGKKKQVFASVDYSAPVADRTPTSERKPNSLEPSWKKLPVSSTANQSYLHNTKDRVSFEPTLPQVLDERSMLELRSEYEDMNRDYELRSRFGLVGIQGERDQYDRVKGFANGSFVKKLGEYQGNKSLESLKEAANRNEDVATVAKPVGLVGAVAVRLYNGRPFTILRHGDTRLSGATKLRDRTGNLALTSPYLNGNFDYSNEAPAPGTPVDLSRTDERYRVSVSRGIPMFDLSSGVTYGASTTRMTASLSKPVADNLTCVLDSSHPLDKNRGTAEETVKLLYGISF